MRIIVSDTSCMIDLGKGRLVREVLQLPYTFVMPDVLFEDELLDFGQVPKENLLTFGLQVLPLDSQGTSRAIALFTTYRPLSVHDSFALALAEQTEDCILLTGDRTLRRAAVQMGIEVHGVLWIIDKLEHHGVGSIEQLYEALRLFAQDDLVFLPQEEIRRRLRRLSQLMK